MADASLVGVGATLCALSAVFGGVTLKTQREHREWCARGVKADGVVSRLGERRSAGLSENADGTSSDPAFTLVPVVRFRADNGFEYEIDAPEAPSTIGSVVEVAYAPSEPSGARAVARKPKVGCTVFLFVFGLALVLYGLTRPA
jgi:hypothetical protein